MVRGMFRSRTFRRVSVKVPGGKTLLHHLYRKPKGASCAACGKNLHGIPRKRPTEMHNLAKTEKRPERPYGGMLCSSCMREQIKSELR